jgi:hypothetical protein
MSVAADELIAAGDRWKGPYQTWQLAVEHRDRVIDRAERRAIRATGVCVCATTRRRSTRVA